MLQTYSQIDSLAIDINCLPEIDWMALEAQVSLSLLSPRRLKQIRLEMNAESGAEHSERAERGGIDSSGK